MQAPIDIPAQVDKPTIIEAITINHVSKTATAHINDGGRGKTVTIDLTTTVLPLMTATQKTTVQAFLKQCALQCWQVVDDTVEDTDITDEPDFS